MKNYMNKKTLAVVTLLTVTAEGRYIIEMENGSQKSYAASSFKKMFKAVEANDTQETLDRVTEETEPVEVTVDPFPVENPDYVDEPIPKRVEGVKKVKGVNREKDLNKAFQQSEYIRFAMKENCIEAIVALLKIKKQKRGKNNLLNFSYP